MAKLERELLTRNLELLDRIEELESWVCDLALDRLEAYEEEWTSLNNEIERKNEEIENLEKAIADQVELKDYIKEAQEGISNMQNTLQQTEIAITEVDDILKHYK